MKRQCVVYSGHLLRIGTSSVFFWSMISFLRFGITVRSTDKFLRFTKDIMMFAVGYSIDDRARKVHKAERTTRQTRDWRVAAVCAQWLNGEVQRQDNL